MKYKKLFQDKNMIKKIRELSKYRQLISTLVIRELKARYRGTALGYVWSFLNPLLLLLVYSIVFGMSARILVASVVAFGISQTHDLWAFNFWKQKTKGKYLWLRNNASTVVSQLLDTTLFMFIAFYHMTPKFTTQFVVSLIIPYWLLKVLVAALDTPICYLGVKWLKS